jgi:ribosomal protein L32
MSRGRPPKTPQAGADTSQPSVPAKEKESKQATLKRLAEKRIPKAVHAIQVCGNLGAYQPSEAQVNAILNALVSAVNGCKASLTRSAGKGEQFSLPFPE